MSFAKLLTPDREELSHKIYNGIHDNANANCERDSRKDYFCSLVKKNKELSENEKEFCKEKFIYQFELDNATDKRGEPRECNNCKTTRYSDKYCEKCISLHLQSLFSTWTSGNEIIDGFIQKCQQLSSPPAQSIECIWVKNQKTYLRLKSNGINKTKTINIYHSSFNDIS